jgi:hypothetical protein
MPHSGRSVKTPKKKSKIRKSKLVRAVKKAHSKRFSRSKKR